MKVFAENNWVLDPYVEQGGHLSKVRISFVCIKPKNNSFPHLVEDKSLNSKEAIFVAYRNFRTFTRTADYPQRSIFAVRRKNVQQITRTGLLPAPQN